MIDGRARLLGLVNAAWTTQAIAAACELGLPDRMGPEPVPVGAIAAKADADAVRRLLRALATLGLCRESPQGFALTPDGEMMRCDHPRSVSAWARLSGGQIWRHWGLLGESVRTGESARLRIHGADDFGYLDADPRRAALFNAAMADLTRPVAEATARMIDWSVISSFVDVGGGVGEMAAVILSATPHVRGAVFELPHAVAAARAYLEAAGVAARCDVVAGSFFDHVPLHADAYLMKSVLHNWDDERAARILGRVAAAMHSRARLLIVERVVPMTLSTQPADQEVMRSDLNMLVGCGGRERTLAEFEALLGKAGLRLESCETTSTGFDLLIAGPRT